MKSYSYLYDYCLSENCRKRSIKAAKKSKRIRQMCKNRNLSDDDLREDSYDWIENYENSNHSPKIIRDGTRRKIRKILVPTLEELIVQHCVVDAMKPLLTKGMYEHSYASLPKRGAHKGKKAIQKWMTHDKKHTKYVLKMDIHHFFDSIPHDILKEKLSKHIHDPQFLKLLFEIIDVTDEGLPLGFYTSQWLSNWYLQDLDHYIKEELHAPHYIRYMDDMAIFSSNKHDLHKMRVAIEKYLNKRLGLELKANWQVFLFDWKGRGRDLDFMGFRFFRNRTLMRKTIMLKATRKARHMHAKAFITIYDARQMMSYLGWIAATDTYGMYLKWIKPIVNFQRLKRYISKVDKVNPMRIYYELVKLYAPSYMLSG